MLLDEKLLQPGATVQEIREMIPRLLGTHIKARLFKGLTKHFFSRRLLERPFWSLQERIGLLYEDSFRPLGSFGTV
jgi:hypothetical protein